ncbi:unnamed protein product [Cochlearia groenlandica]
MANKEEHPPPPRGNEWEVVSLTSSAYAPYKYDAYYGPESSHDLYMSGHFVFPPSEHENLPIDDPLFLDKDEEERKDGEDLLVDSSNTRFQDEVVHSIYGEPALASSRHMESFEHGLTDTEPNEYAERDLHPHGLEKDAKKAIHNLPCEAWWRKRAVSVYSRTREANAMWSLFFAAAVTGLVVLGQRWQQERWQVLQLKWQSSIGGSEKLSRVLEPLSRLKDLIVRSNPQASLIRSGSSSEV